MQLALTPEVLVPVGVGVVLLLLALAAVLIVRHQRRLRTRARTTVTDALSEAAAAPTEDALADDIPVENPVVDVPAGGGPDGPPAARPGSGPAERVGSGRTVAAAVAQALAVREARARLNASSPEDRVAGDDRRPQTDGPQTVGPQTVGPQTAVPRTDVPRTDVPQADVPRPVVAIPVLPTPVVPGLDGPAPADGPAPDAPGAPGGIGWQEPVAAPRGRGDARDRLLAVLLDDPVRAVGAAVELEACRRQMDRLTDAVRHERHVLGSVLARLAEAGLAPDQLARLSGLSDEELRTLLPTRVSV